MKQISEAPDYWISIDGVVYSAKRYGGSWRPLKARTDYNTGYKYVTLMIDGKPYTKRVHRLVAEAYLPKPNGKYVTNHKDGNKSNNHLSNLEWVTYSENTRHSYQNGLQAIGENHSQAKYTDAQISMIFELRRQGLVQTEIAKKLGMSQPHVSAVLRGKLRSK